MADVSFHGVEKTYPNGFKAIHAIDLAVPDGDFLVLVGPSGCGKSTLLRMVAGLESVTAGEIHIGGAVVNQLEPARRDIAMVFQNYALYPHMSVYDNMAYGLRNRGTPKAEIERRVREVAGILQLEPLLSRKPRQMSGGQRQRVAMGRAMVREPAAFLFDEPLSNLDAKLRTQMRLEIRQLQRRLGATSIYVTHDQVEAMTMADRLVVMNGGVAEQTGRPLEVYARPANRFVAGFIGSPAMNFLEGRIADDGAGVEVATAEGAWSLPHPPADTALAPGRPVTVGIRPEHLSLTPPGAHAAGTFLKVTAEHLGAETILHGTLGPEGANLVVRLGQSDVVEAPRYGLAVTAPHLHLFDPQTGVRL